MLTDVPGISSCRAQEVLSRLAAMQSSLLRQLSVNAGERTW